MPAVCLCATAAGYFCQTDRPELFPAVLRMKADAPLRLLPLCFSSPFSCPPCVTRALSFHMEPAGELAPWSPTESRHTHKLNDIVSVHLPAFFSVILEYQS